MSLYKMYRNESTGGKGMKPHWKDAPPWANYLAMNILGKWSWYECMPDVGYGNWCPNGMYKDVVEPRPDWIKSLERKPQWILILHTFEGFTQEIRWGMEPPQIYRYPKRTRITGPVAEMPDSSVPETLNFALRDITGNVANYYEVGR